MRVFWEGGNFNLWRGGGDGFSWIFRYRSLVVILKIRPFVPGGEGDISQCHLGEKFELENEKNIYKKIVKGKKESKY